MDEKRAQIIDNFFNARKRLNIADAVYKQWVFKFTFLELEKDLAENGDITTNSLKIKKKNFKARIYANQPGIMAGGEEIEYFIDKSDPAFRPRLGHLKVLNKVNDGDPFMKDDMLFEYEGDIHDILKSERVILNFLQHLCGIAARTRKLNEKVKTINKDILLCPTRKTTWGWLDKKAVIMGGGGTHRLTLADAVLIKDNHLALFDYDIKKLFSNFTLPVTEYAFVEIELQDSEKLSESAFYLNRLQSLKKLPIPMVIMLDNIQPEKIKKFIEEMHEKKLDNFFLFEASGGINEDNIIDYTKSGVDVISMGSITQKIQPIDLSLEIGKIN
ncbi:carboxylating nicotinate-nucleotide diphosphorylase [Candidatus Peregrinibacteria bacterium]|nr:carboxylating nicotinate-nucleotide diphosphorylase [Candidatus Peregrinibacteria bacterium]